MSGIALSENCIYLNNLVVGTKKRNQKPQKKEANVLNKAWCKRELLLA